MSAYEERLNEIEEAMKTDGCNTVADINTITLGKYPASTLNRYVKILAENKPELGWVKEGEERFSMWRKGKMSFKKPERYPESKNDEGYNDPTAAMAMKNVDLEYNPDDFGLILTRSTVDAGLEYYIQLQDFGPCGNLVVPMIQRDKWIGATTPHMLTYRFNNVNYYIDCRKLRTLNPKWVIGNEGYISKNTMTSVRTIIMRMLGFNIPETQVVEKPVEKIVEKVVEKPVKEIVEVEKPVEVVREVIKWKTMPPEQDNTDPIAAIDIQMAEKRAEVAEAKLSVWEEVGRGLISALGSNTIDKEI